MKKYGGSLIIVSHDRDFLDGLVDKLYEFRDGKVKEHLGGVEDFLRRLKIETLNELERHKSVPSEPAARETAKSDESKAEYQKNKFISKEERKIKNRISFLEKCIGELETRMKAIETTLAAPGPDDDIMDLTREYLELKRDLDAKTEEWGKLI